MSGSASGRSARRRATACIAVGGVCGAYAVIGLVPTLAGASSHREAPLIAADPAVDNTDVYAFVSPDEPDTVTFIANWIPFEEPNGGPNFYPFADDARVQHQHRQRRRRRGRTSTIRWTLQERSTSGATTRSCTTTGRSPRSTTRTCCSGRRTRWRPSHRRRSRCGSRISDAPVAPSHVGAGVDAGLPDAARPGRHQLAERLEGASPARPTTRSSSTCGSSTCSTAATSARSARTRWPGYNVNTIALQVPIKDIALERRRRRATRSSASGAPPSGQRVRDRPTATRRDGDWVQVSRLGKPLVNEVVVPAGLKDTFNAIPPGQGRATSRPIVDRVTNPEVPQLIEAIYGCRRPPTPAQRPGRDLPDRHHHQGRRPDQGRPQLAAQQRRRRSRRSSGRRRCCG